MAAVSVVRAERAWIAGAFVPAEIRIVDGVITEVLQAGDALAAPVAVRLARDHRARGR
jgi:allantoinase